jgi:hypothetical protein
MAARQARATGKDYTLCDMDGLSLSVTAKGESPGISVTTGMAGRNACHWALTRQSG